MKKIIGRNARCWNNGRAVMLALASGLMGCTETVELDDLESEDAQVDEQNVDSLHEDDAQSGYAFTEASFSALGRTTGSLTSPTFTGIARFSPIIPGVVPTITRHSAGVYTVNLGGTPPSTKFVAHVTALGSNATYCRVVATTGAQIDIRCVDPVSDDEIDTHFSLWATNHLDSVGIALRTTSSGSTPSPLYVTTGSTATVTRTSTGRYTATINGVTWVPNSANITVSSYGNSPGVLCKASTWSSSGGNSTINVRCDNRSGTAADSRFMLSMLKAPKPDPTYVAGYAYGYVTAAGTIGGAANSIGSNIAVSKPGSEYQLSNASLTNHSSIKSAWTVSATGNDSKYCKLSSTATITTATALCFTAGGSLSSGDFSTIVVQGTNTAPLD